MRKHHIAQRYDKRCTNGLLVTKYVVNINLSYVEYFHSLAGERKLERETKDDVLKK